VRNKKLVFVFSLLFILLTGCGEKTILPYEEAYKKLDDAGYEIIASKDENEILDKIHELSESYDISIEKNGPIFSPYVEHNPQSLAENVSGFILAKKDISFAFIFYCNDGDTSYIIGRLFDELSGQFIAPNQRVMGGSDNTYFYFCSYDVNAILNLSDDD